MELTFPDLISMFSLSPRRRLPDSSDHFVEFYDNDPALIDSIARFISTGLNQGEAAIVVATRAHAGALDEAFRNAGVNTDGAREQGLLVSLDARESLDLLMHAGMPSTDKFEELMGATISRAAAGGRRVRIFGEMVALLWEQGNLEGALRLEDLWNYLAESHRFRLFCAYPVGAFGERDLAPLRAVCHSHTHLITAESTA